MARINPDDLSDAPLEQRPPGADAPRAPITPQVDAVLCEILALQGSGTADWAADTLDGMYETIRRTGVVTGRQRAALANIEAAATRRGGQRDRWQRRWDRDR